MKKILAIDDQQDNLITIKAVINGYMPDCEVLTTLSGKEGIEIAQKEQPDTILLDIIMPQMDGYEVCKRLKENQLTKHIPVVMVTAIKTDSESRVKGLNIGADAFLSKPIDPVELSAQVNVMLRIKVAEDKLRGEKETLEELVQTRTSELIDSYKDIKLEVSERKKAEVDLGKGERIYETLLNNLPGFTYRCKNDKNWTMKYISAGCEDITGYSPDDFINNKNIAFNDIIETDYQEKIWDKWKKILKNKAIFEYEYPIIKKNKELSWIWERGCGIYSDNDELLYLEGFITDITDRKKTNDALQLTQFSVDNLTDAVYWMGPDAKFIYVNDEAVKVLGYSKEELLTMTFHDIDPNFPVEIWKDHWTELKEKKSFILHTIHQRKDKSTFPVELTVNFMQFGDKEINCVIAKDITERKRTEQIQKALYNISNAVSTTDNLEKLIALIQKELGAIIDTTNFFVALYDNKTDTITLPFHIDQKDKITSFPAGKSLTAWVVKTKKSLLVTKDVKIKLVENGDVEIIGADSKVWLGVPLLVNGKITGAFAVQSYTDEFAYDESDKEMLEFIAEQISISIERKKADEEIINAKEKAEESDRLKTSFLLNVSHEIRTPMNGIMGFSKLLQKPGNSLEKSNRYTSIIVDSGNQLLSIIDDILDVSKIETGQIDLFEEEINLDSILNDILTLFKIRTDEKGLSLNLITDVSIKNPVILVDKSKFKQIFFNLIGNALKFTDKGNIDFGYKIKGNQLEFFVKDTGIGISKKYQKDIFDRFHKIENHATKLYGGTGLGLSICSGLLEKMGGEIWVVSEENKGAVFYFTIPYKTSTKKKLTKQQEKIFESNLSGFTILIVEDEETNASYLEEILESRKMKHILAKDGKQAIEMFKKYPGIDLILMDIKLPEMDGYTATKEIKKINSKIPIIAQTAYAVHGDKEKSLNAGCDDYIAKPIEEDKLINLLKKYLING
ncbi:MAG: response regulator [Bacteroidales bacterium]|jgi:PAS domain S-box-containing protein|nr:response regulator [Bacteroidales bacterium]